MKVIICSAIAVFAILGNNASAQTEKRTNPEYPQLQKRVDTQGSSDSNSKTVLVEKKKSEDLADPSKKVINGSTSSNTTLPSPATRTTSNVKIDKIEYSLDNNNSTLTNLLTLIEIKEKVNETNNQNLLSSTEYKTLLSDINKLRAEFDTYVESKGIENCSTLEQSHYLAFLKEEGKEEAYQSAMKKLK